MQHNTATLAKR